MAIFLHTVRSARGSRFPPNCSVKDFSRVSLGRNMLLSLEISGKSLHTPSQPKLIEIIVSKKGRNRGVDEKCSLISAVCICNSK